MTTLREICDAAIVEVESILQAPLHDPAAPPGFLTPGFVEAETRRRHAAVQAVTESLLATIERRYGPVAGTSAREHLEPLLKLFDGTTVH